MKNIIYKLLRTVILLSLIIFSVNSFSQDGPPPPPPGGSSGGGGGTGGSDGLRNGAPIGSGLIILLGLGSAYGGYKGYRFYRKKKKSLPD